MYVVLPSTYFLEVPAARTTVPFNAKALPFVALVPSVVQLTEALDAGTVIPVAGPYVYDPTLVSFRVAEGTLYEEPTSPLPPDTVKEIAGAEADGLSSFVNIVYITSLRDLPDDAIVVVPVEDLVTFPTWV